MSTYSQIAWLPLTGGLVLLGLIAGFIVWRRRGAGAGLRIAAWSLLPLAAYLIGVVELLWRFGTAIANFASSFVFSQRGWAGIIVLGVAIVLFVVSGSMRGRARRKGGGKAVTQAAGNGAGSSVPAAKPGKAISTGKGKASGLDDDVLGDAAEVLRRHGIR